MFCFRFLGELLDQTGHADAFGGAEVNEAGTEAAAATAASMGITSAPEPKSFDATRPLLFVIRDLGTGAALFVGRVVDPTPSRSGSLEAWRPG